MGGRHAATNHTGICHGAGFPKGGRVRARGLRKVLGGVGLLGVEPGPTAATGGCRAVERPLGLPTSVCARGRAWERRSLLGRAGLVGSPAGRLVHGVCGGVPIVPGEGGHQAAATAGVAALPCLVLARLVKYGCCCPWPRGAPRGGQLALRGSVVVVKLLHRCCDGPVRVQSRVQVQVVCGNVNARSCVYA